MLFIMLQNVVLTFESVDGILGDHSKESYRAVLSFGAVYYAAKCVSVDKVLNCPYSDDTYRAILSRGTVLLCCARWLQLLICAWSEILKGDDSNESYPTVLSCDIGRFCIADL